MNIVLFTKHRGRIAAADLGQRALLAAALLILLGAAALFYAGYRFAAPGLTADSDDVTALLSEQLASERAQLGDASKRVDQHLDALAVQLGRLQARATRLDALGRRLTEMAGLDKGEFDFDTIPAQGGPQDVSSLHSLSAPEFIQSLDELQRQVEDRANQLSVLESLLMNQNLQAQVYPAGRPVNSGWISSYFGKRTDPFTGKREMHKGMDFAGKAGADVVAVASGVVTWADDRYGYGKLVEINHGNGYLTRYGHNKRLLVKVGDKVDKGQTVALMGSTGRSTGPHVHFEVIRDGKVLDPAKYIRAAR